MTAATGAMTGAMTAATGAMTAATGAMTGKTTAATGAMTGKTGVVAGPGCSGNRKLNDQGHAAVRASGARAARQRWRSSPDQNARADLNAAFTPWGAMPTRRGGARLVPAKEERSAGRRRPAAPRGRSGRECSWL